MLPVPKHPNSFMQFCTNDELLKVPESGLGGGKYDLVFLDQYGDASVSGLLARKIYDKPPNTRLIQRIPRTNATDPRRKRM